MSAFSVNAGDGGSEHQALLSSPHSKHKSSSGGYVGDAEAGADGAAGGGEGAKAVAKTHGRLVILDVTRGFIMVIMAVDHISAIIAHVHGDEMWSGETLDADDAMGRLKFATRFVTHLCAPGFLLLMGAGVTLFTASRVHLGWSTGRIVRHHLLRSFILIFPCAFPIEKYGFSLAMLIWPKLISNKWAGCWYVTTVLFALASSMAVCGLVMPLVFPSSTRARWRWRGVAVWHVTGLLAAALLIFVASDLTVLHYEHTDEQNADVVPWIVRILAVPGRTHDFYVLYAMLPWLGTGLAGCALGLALLTHSHRLRRFSAVVGALCLCTFLLVRELGGFGNLVPARSHSAVDMLNVVKYPPSLAFTLLTLGMLFSLIAIFLSLSELGSAPPFSHWLWVPLKTFGGSALFYYLMHLWLISLFGLIFNPKGYDFVYIYPTWAGLEVILFPMCWYYGRFKRQTAPNSIWRFF